MSDYEGTYELKHKHGSFHDFETGLNINREEQAEVKEPIGKATLTAIQSGRLLLVRTPRKPKAEGEPSEQTKGKGK